MQPEGGSVGEATSSPRFQGEKAGSSSVVSLGVGASWLEGTWPSSGAMLTQVDTQAEVPRVLNPFWPQVLFCVP